MSRRQHERGALLEGFGGRVQLVGDDIFVTKPAIIRRAITEGSATRP